jgi:PKD repeat protein
MKKILYTFLILSTPSLQAQIANSYTHKQTNFAPYFNKAYQLFPDIPQGLLEAVAWSQTRITHIDSSEAESCMGLPRVYGVMGLTLDGKNYFKNNLIKISNLSGYSTNEIINSPEKNILAYAKAYHTILQQKNNLQGWKKHENILTELGELPEGNAMNDFAQKSFTYMVFTFLNDAEKQTQYNFPNYAINLQDIYGDNLQVLQAQKIKITPQGLKTETGITYQFLQDEGNYRSPDYGPALWNPAPTCNYSSRNGTPVSAITIHTIQGTYAGAISWSQNCNSNVSFHYVLRSSDGQITQMVLEANKAWHVGSENPYTIGYEHEGYVTQPQWYTQVMYQSSANISKDVCNSGYGINPLRTYFGNSSSGINVLGSCTKIKGHQHYPNQTHTDPGINWDWEKYYKLINDNPIITPLNTTSGTFYDSGGQSGNYANDERKLWLIAPPGATSVTLTFSSFNLENNWDFLFIYNGNNTSSPLIGKYTGTNSPGTVTSSGGAILVEFRSDCATTAAGWAASWTSNATPPPPSDLTPPTTQILPPANWVTQDFIVNFNDADNVGGSGIEKAFYQVIDFDGTDWRANAQRGFFSDNFDLPNIHPDWTNASGNWNINNGYLQQTDENNGNTNIYAYINHSLSNRYLYHWAGKMEGSGNNRRAGLHYFCDQPNLTNRGNSYFIWFRLDNDKVQLYKVTNDVFTMVDEVNFNFNANQWYDFKVMYDRITGKHMIYIDNSLVQTWTDSSPYASGNYVSFRSGNCIYTVNNFKIFRSRNTSTNILVGANGDLRYQNTNPLTPAGKIKSIVNDNAGNISAESLQNINVDWTAPNSIIQVNDGTGADINITYNNTQLSANWSSSSDTHSDIARYWFAIGTAPAQTDIQNWTDNAWYDSVTVTGLNLSYGTTYYFSVRAENGAGLLSPISSSDGQLLQVPFTPPTVNYYAQSSYLCINDSVTFINNTSNANSYYWFFPGGSPATSTAVAPKVYYASSGTYNVKLIATGPGGIDSLEQTIQIQIDPLPLAQFTETNDTVYLPNAFVGFNNQSVNANGYYWNFGDGNFSTGFNPWHLYTQPGVYMVSLIAINGTCPNDTLTKSIVVLNANQVNNLEENHTLLVFPNPINEQTHIILFSDNYKNTPLEIYDINGKLIFSKIVNLNPGENKIKLDPTVLAAGKYFVKINNRIAVFQKH